MDLSKGIIYVAWGEQFTAEAVVSARQVRRVMNVPIVLVTNGHSRDFLEFDEVILEPLSKSYRDKILMRLSPFEKTIFLDTDTFVLEPLDQLYEMLTRFDIVYQPSGPSSHYDLPGVPMLAFEEPSAGIIAWRRNAAVESLFDRWGEEYELQQRLNGDGAWDQRSLRSALWKSDLKIYGLGQDWQLISFFAGIAMNKVRMVHGRGLKAKRAVSVCNRAIGPRIYIPDIGFFSTFQSTPLDYVLLSFRIARLALKRFVRIVLDRMGVWKIPVNKRPM